MNHLAIFYHCRLSGGNPPCDPAWASSIMAEQMSLLRSTSLAKAASQIHIGSNGGTVNALMAESLAAGVGEVRDNGEQAESELPTLAQLRAWLPGHEDWYVLYFHSKGATHPNDPGVIRWRRCMENVVLRNWRQCVADLDAGYDSVGAHWLTPEQFPGYVKSPFWGGNVWWATARFLMTLPAIPDNARCREDFFIAENWIGLNRKRPLVKDYAPHWPLNGCP